MRPWRPLGFIANDLAEVGDLRGVKSLRIGWDGPCALKITQCRVSVERRWRLRDHCGVIIGPCVIVPGQRSHATKSNCVVELVGGSGSPVFKFGSSHFKLVIPIPENAIRSASRVRNPMSLAGVIWVVQIRRSKIGIELMIWSCDHDKTRRVDPKDDTSEFSKSRWSQMLNDLQAFESVAFSPDHDARPDCPPLLQ